MVFFVDDEPVHTVFAPPYTMSLNSRKFPDGPHEFKAEAFDLAGNPGADSRSSDILNIKDTTLPQVVITFPSGDQVVSGDVLVKATASDDNGLFSGTFYVDGEWAGNWFPQTPGEKKTTIEMPWYTAAESNAPHRIAFQVFDLDLNAGTGVQDVVVNNTAPPAPPDINVTRALVNHGHFMTVILNVANVGEAAAANLKIRDPMQLYQPVSREDAHTKYQALFKPETTQWIMDIRYEEPLAGGASVKFMYDVVPVLVYPNHLDPILGGDRYTQATDVWYDDQYNTIYRKFPLAVKEGDYYINTLQSCDYLAVTGPRNLRLFNTQADTDALLSKMAELAILRQGALGYIDLEFSFDIPYRLHWALAVGDVSGVPRPELIVGDPESGLIHIYSSYPVDPCFQGITTCYHLVWFFMKDLGIGLPGKLFHLGDSLSTFSSQGGSKRDIVHLNCNSDSLSVYSYLGATIMNFAIPSMEPYAGLAMGNVTGDSGSEFLIADHVRDKVYIYNTNGTKYGEFDRVYDVFDGFAAGDVLGDDSEEIIIAAQSAKKVFVLSPAGAVLSSFTLLFEKGDRLAVGNAIASWKNDKKEIIIGKHKSRKIYILNAQGTLLKSFDSLFDYLGGLAAGNILDGFNDDILVGYTGDEKIFFYNADHVSGKRDVLQDLLQNQIHPDPLAKGPGTWKPGGAWSSLLHNSWTFSGYLLIVGETEIVPAFGARWYGAVLTSKGTRGLVADCTDLPYANTFDDEIHPELNTGRIIGNSAKELMKPIQAAIDQINGTSLRHFDRSDAL
ncbi:MAG TPA: Ig-like domain-containing protein, partial [Candidatus Sumerlaeota bacterium]|nr:Ig-like domain-containing protein [Candidatus Sumerlaeota bacterium]